jgi:hypothetical protein
MKTALPWLVCCLLRASLSAQPSWPETLKTMPLPEQAPPLDREHAMSVMLQAFRSNDMVKALIFLPGVADDFYLVNRNQPKLNVRARTLAEAVTVLTNATDVRVTFSPPFLLLHLDRDHLEPNLAIRHNVTADRLRRQHHLSHRIFCDQPWPTVQPILKATFGLNVLPKAASDDAGHLYRLNLAGWDLSDWEWLQAVCLATRAELLVQRNKVLFSRPAGTKAAPLRP